MTSSISLLGASRPRVEGHPEFTESLGDLAIDLAARAGLILDQWQQDSLRVMMAVRPNGKWVCRHYCEWIPRQNGKGVLLKARALAGFLLLGEKEIVWSAHEFKTAHLEFTRLWALFQVLGTEVRPGDPTLFNIPVGPGKSIRVKVTQGNDNKGFKRLDTKATILFVARSKGSGRGFSGDLIILDEAYALTAEQQDALQPTMRARPFAQVVYVSTPPLDGDSGEIMHEMRARAEAGDFTRLGYRDWGLAGDLDHLEKVDLDDRAGWAASNPALGIRLDEEDVEDDRRTMRARGGRGFARECLGIWPLPLTVAGGSIATEDWQKILELGAEATRDRSAGCALGVDLSLQKDYGAIFLYGHTPDGLGFGRLVDYVAGTDWIVPRLELLRELLEPVAIGMGRHTFKYLETALKKARITEPADPAKPLKGDLAVLGAADMAAAAGHVLTSTRHHTVRIKTDEDQPEILDDAVAGAKTRRIGDAIVWAHKDEDSETSPVGAWTAARWAFYERITAAKSYAPATAPAAPPGGNVRELFRPIERLNI
ncbi:hypothetical protein [Actinophytocola sp.]|uniref:hypothetical protein n=1 Tax=Actinophytocola sp. TaxID=1872138 RepID=UPI002D31D9E0|nr:hypothetical protein [Actinophytocola sp.]HYQ63565.1 hypothetical protein [Actinophytocola sp.]